MNGISIIVPACNAESTLEECLRSVTALNWKGEIEIILVNDGSTDRTAGIAASFPGIKAVNVPHQGAARATNIGIQLACHDIVAFVEADVVLEKDWLEKITPVFDDPSVAAVGGCIVTANKSSIGKIAGYDVESRLSRAPTDIDHLSNTNTAYRRQVLIEVGLLSEELKADYDVGLSRSLKAAGYRLILRKDIKCKHYWKDNLKDYLRQQYNYAYYRMTLAWKSGKAHDQVTGLSMVLQVPFTGLILLFSIFGSLVFRWAPLTLSLLILIHLPETFLLLCRRKEARILLLPLLFGIRNLCWVWAAIIWGTKHLVRAVSRAVSGTNS